MASCCSWELSFPGRGTDPVKSLFCHRNLFFIAAETLKFFIASLPSVAVVNASPAKSHFPLLQAEIRGLQRGLPLCAASVFFLPRGRAGDAVDVTFLAADRRMSRLHLVTLLLKPGTPTSNGPGFLERSTAREAPAIFGAPCLEHGQLAISVGIYELCPEEGNEIYPGNQALQGITFPVLSSAQTARCLQVSVKSWFLIAFY